MVEKENAPQKASHPWRLTASHAPVKAHTTVLTLAFYLLCLGMAALTSSLVLQPGLATDP